MTDPNDLKLDIETCCIACHHKNLGQIASKMYDCYCDTLRTTMPFVTAHLEIFHCTHHPVIPKSDLYFTFCSTLTALSKRTSK